MPTKKILPLSQDIIAKIAAGEVIERPVYAVKELVENALDAKASAITIQIEESGLRKITVIDNGEGMSKEDLKESFKLHTTSKVSAVDHLSHIATLGFRGEALASIAAISTMIIQSRTKKSAGGTKVELKNGKVITIAPVGMPAGTIVTVTNLFHSVPARKKFLKSSKTEFRHIISLVTTFALANPQVHFVLTHNKKTVFDLPQSTGVVERIKLLLGTKLFTNLLPFSYQDNYLSISGFLAKPQEKTYSSSKQFLFINNRKVLDKLIGFSIKESYGTLIDPKSLPIFIVFITLPYEFVDVNVHPRKEFVRFSDTQFIINSVQKAVSETLTKNNLTFYDETGFGFGLSDAKLTQSFAGRIIKESQIPWDIRVRNEIGRFHDIIQLHNLYLVTQTKFGVALIDQHGAHERILYEQFLEAFKNKRKQSPQYHLPKPAVLEFSFTEIALLDEYQELLRNLGFTIELFKENTYLVSSVPLLFQDRNPAEFVREMLSDLEREKIHTIDKASAKMIAYLASRGAIKAGESLTKKQAKDLLEKLEVTNNNATCPHGRPTKIVIDVEQLHRMFKRK
jgi:DNA mismatch repair protein MutL